MGYGFSANEVMGHFFGFDDRNFQIEFVDPEILEPHPKNPRLHSEKGLDYLKKSIEDFGWVQNVVVQRGTNYVLIGNGRVEVAKRLKEKRIPVLYVDLPLEESERLMVIDNAIRDHSKWDTVRLAKVKGLEGREDQFALNPIQRSRLAKISSFRSGANPFSGQGEVEVEVQTELTLRGSGKYGMPPFDRDWSLPADFLRKNKIRLYVSQLCKNDPSDVVWWWGWGGDKLPRQFQNSVICHFYRYDPIILSALRRFEQTVRKLWLLQVKAVVMPDLSIYLKDPLSKRLGVIYDRHYYSCLFALNGFYVIPDIPMLDRQTIDAYVEGFPDGSDTISVTLQNLENSRPEYTTAVEWIFREVVKRLGVKGMIVYGGEQREKEDLIPWDLLEVVVEIPNYQTFFKDKVVPKLKHQKSGG